MVSEIPDVIVDHGLPLRQLRRPEHLRALAHPRRMELIDLLIAEGALTATECAARLGDSPGGCSYHLRQLARYGFVEEAPGGRGRQRPWRYLPMGNRLDEGNTEAERTAGAELAAVLDERNARRVRDYRTTSASDPWHEAAMSSDWSVWLTEEELAQVAEQIAALLAPLQKRTFDGFVPDGARLIDAITYLLPRPTRPDA